MVSEEQLKTGVFEEKKRKSESFEYPINETNEEEELRRKIIQRNKEEAMERRKLKQKEREDRIAEIYRQSEITPVDEVLAFDISELSTQQDVELKFDVIAHKLLNKVELVSGNTSFRICEIEFYLNGGIHCDLFTHSDKQQLTHGQWYFHRTGNQYRTGNYKGLDITFAKGTKVYGGILIRAIEEIKTQKLYDGPCVSVNRLLSIHGCNEVVPFIEKKGWDWHCTNVDNLIFIRDIEELEQRTLYKCPRVGLTLKKTTGKRSVDISRDYRYLSAPKEIKKGRPNLIIGLYKNGKSAQEISKLTNTPISTCQSYIKLFEEGKNETVDKYYNTELDTDSLCKLFGASSMLH